MASNSQEDGLKRLEYLSLISKVCAELETHLGFGDKVLAEFITELGRDCEKEYELDAKLKENGAEMPDYFVRSLLIIIRAILPPTKAAKSEKEVMKEIEKEIELETREQRRKGGRGDREDDRERGNHRNNDRWKEGKLKRK